MKLSFAIALLSFLMQAFNANVVRTATCTRAEDGIAYYEICGEEFGEYSDAHPGDISMLFMNDMGTADITDDRIEWSYIVEER